MKDFCLSQFKEALGALIQEHESQRQARGALTQTENQDTVSDLDLTAINHNLFRCPETGCWPFSLASSYKLFDHNGSFDPLMADKLGVRLSLEKLTIPKILKTLPQEEQLYYSLSFRRVQQGLKKRPFSEHALKYLLSEQLLLDLFKDLSPEEFLFQRGQEKGPSASLLLALSGSLPVENEALSLLSPELSCIGLNEKLNSKVSNLFLVGEMADNFKRLYYPSLDGRVPFNRADATGYFSEPLFKNGCIKSFQLHLSTHHAVRVYAIEAESEDCIANDISDLLRQANLQAGNTLVCGARGCATTRRLLQVLSKDGLNDEMFDELYGELSLASNIRSSERSSMASKREKHSLQPLLWFFLEERVPEEQKEWITIKNKQYKAALLLALFLFELNKAPHAFLQNRLIFEALAVLFAESEEKSAWLTKVMSLIELSIEQLTNQKKSKVGRILYLAISLKTFQVLWRQCDESSEKKVIQKALLDLLENSEDDLTLFTTPLTLLEDLYTSLLGLTECINQSENMDESLATLSRLIQTKLQLIRPNTKTEAVDRLSLLMDKVRRKITENEPFFPTEEEKKWLSSVQEQYQDLIMSLPIGARRLREAINEGYAPACHLLLGAAEERIVQLFAEDLPAKARLLDALSFLGQRHWPKENDERQKVLSQFNKFERLLCDPHQSNQLDKAILCLIAPMIKRRKQNTQLLEDALSRAEQALRVYFETNRDESFSRLEQAIEQTKDLSSKEDHALYQKMRRDFSDDDSWFEHYLVTPLFIELRDQIRELIDSPLYENGKRVSSEHFRELKESFQQTKCLSPNLSKTLNLLFPFKGRPGLEEGVQTLENFSNECFYENEACVPFADSIKDILIWVDGMAFASGKHRCYLDVLEEKITGMDRMLWQMRQAIVEKSGLNDARNRLISSLKLKHKDDGGQLTKKNLTMFSKATLKRGLFLRKFIPKFISGFSLTEPQKSFITYERLMKNETFEETNPGPIAVLKALLRCFLTTENFHLSEGLKSQLEEFLQKNVNGLPELMVLLLREHSIKELLARAREVFHQSSLSLETERKLAEFNLAINSYFCEELDKKALYDSLPPRYQLSIMMAVQAAEQTMSIEKSFRHSSESPSTHIHEPLRFYANKYQQRRVLCQRVENNLLARLLKQEEFLSEKKVQEVILVLAEHLKEQTTSLSEQLFLKDRQENSPLLYEDLEKWCENLIKMEEFLQEHGVHSGLDYRLFSIKWALSNSLKHFFLPSSGKVTAKKQHNQAPLILRYLAKEQAGNPTVFNDALNIDQQEAELKEMQQALMALYQSLRAEFKSLHYPEEFVIENFITLSERRLRYGLAQNELVALLNFSIRFLAYSKHTSNFNQRSNQTLLEDIDKLENLVSSLQAGKKTHEETIEHLGYKRSKLLEKFFIEHQNARLREKAFDPLYLFKRSSVDYTDKASLTQWVQHARGQHTKLGFWSTGQRTHKVMQTLGWLDENKNLLPDSELDELIQEVKRC